MSTAAPKSPRPAVVVAHDMVPSEMKNLIRLAPAALFSLVFHGVLFGLFILLAPSSGAEKEVVATKEDTPLVTENNEDIKKDPFLTTDVDPAATEFDTDINYNVDRKADVSVPGLVNPNEAVGIHNGDMSAAPTNLPAPGGFGSKGTGGAIDGMVTNTANMAGVAGGYNPRGLPLAGSFFGRSGATREKALREGGGTGASEAAVTKGLKWLVKVQNPDGSWSLDGNYPNKGNQANPTAGTAFGLLPLLAAGKTHKPGTAKEPNPYDKPVEKALLYLIRIQDKKNGNFGGGMYGHGLAAIAMCEAYGLSQDPMLRRPAQMGLNYIIFAQNEGGGWRYQPGEAGDLSVTGWQVMALKSGMMAGLDVPAVTIRKAQRYLDSVCNTNNEGYAYVGAENATPVMTAVGLLCRQYLQSWGPQNLRMIKAIDTHIKPSQPDVTKNAYYYYYATQVMHHFGGQAWKDWNGKMREHLVKTQATGALEGSWTPQAGDPWTATGGRLMATSLNLLTLEVYYRYLPLYYRESGAKMDETVKKAI